MRKKKHANVRGREKTYLNEVSARHKWDIRWTDKSCRRRDTRQKPAPLVSFYERGKKGLINANFMSLSLSLNHNQQSLISVGLFSVLFATIRLTMEINILSHASPARAFNKNNNSNQRQPTATIITKMCKHWTEQLNNWTYTETKTLGKLDLHLNCI